MTAPVPTCYPPFLWSRSISMHCARQVLLALNHLPCTHHTHTKRIYSVQLPPRPATAASPCQLFFFNAIVTSVASREAQRVPLPALATTTNSCSSSSVSSLNCQLPLKLSSSRASPLSTGNATVCSLHHCSGSQPFGR
eukprot:21551-Heterococcus_DN1.PRE.1